ncbi:hypothetical protein FACS1894186_7810 [Alphaproteobacteria bacterium]|nr:hypothetical protein FACS1894186_7810 [Alphaproteobacteria bacterium]
MANNFNPEIVEKFGTPVVKDVLRYVVPLENLNEGILAVSDGVDKYGNQWLDGDGKDALVLNGISKEQAEDLDNYLKQFKNPEKMSTEYVKKFVGFLKKNGYGDNIECVRQDSVDKLMTAAEHGKKVGLYSMLYDKCSAVKVPEGTKCVNDEGVEVIAGKDNLLVAQRDNDGVLHWNIDRLGSDDYSPVAGDKIATYDQAKNDAVSFSQTVLNGKADKGATIAAKSQKAAALRTKTKGSATKGSALAFANRKTK